MERTEPVGFVEPTTDDFLRIFGNPQSHSIVSRGGGLQDIVIYTPHKRGGGILSFFRRTLLPFLKPHLLSFGSNVLGDMANGSQLRDSLKRRGFESVSEIGQRVARGGARKKRRRKTKSKKKNIKKKNAHASEGEKQIN